MNLFLRKPLAQDSHPIVAETEVRDRLFKVYHLSIVLPFLSLIAALPLKCRLHTLPEVGPKDKQGGDNADGSQYLHADEDRCLRFEANTEYLGRRYLGSWHKETGYITPYANMASATFLKPAMLAPLR